MFTKISPHLLYILVRKVGLEPTRPQRTRLLRPLRIPIPPLSRHFMFGTGGGDRTHTEWILSPLPLPDWATPAFYSGAEEETRTPTPFGTGILNRHVYQFHHFRVIHIWCGWWDSNPHAIRQGILSPQCLPIPPHPRGYILVRVEGVEPPTCCF